MKSTGPLNKRSGIAGVTLVLLCGRGRNIARKVGRGGMVNSSYVGNNRVSEAGDRRQARTPRVGSADVEEAAV